tara:strand:- start:190 stop:1422 length:1233 start_codon:yes stop_codon:yes gene_type:complete
MKSQPPSVNNTSPLLRAVSPKKKLFPKNKIFLLVLVLSLALNIYFLFFKKEKEQNSVIKSSFSGSIEGVKASTLSETDKKRFRQNNLESSFAIKKSVNDKLSATKPFYDKPDGHSSKSQKLKFKAKKITFPTSSLGKRRTVHTLVFKITSSLNYSVCNIMTVRQGCRQLSAHIDRLLAWNINMKHQARKGDLTSVIYETLDQPEKFHILKLKYKSVYHLRTFEANYYQIPGRKYGAYFDSKGREIHPRIANSEAPIRDFTEITSLPGDYRKGQFKGHRGTDFKAPTGTPVYAAFDGNVTRKNWNMASNGHSLEIEHPSQKVITRYLHLSRTLVKPGTSVKQGQKIAESGNTGRSFAPHLHYEIQDKEGRAKLLNPFKSSKHKSTYLNVPKSRLDDYKERIAIYDAILYNS